MRVLIVDDQAVDRRRIVQCLARLPDLELHEAASLDAARQVLAANLIDVALIDLRLDEKDPTNRDGMSLVRELRAGTTAVPIMVTASSEMAAIREAMRAGAYAYILKDELCPELVVPVLTELKGRRALESEVLLLHGLVGDSPSMGRLRGTLKKVASIDAPILIVGPTGSGKELAARAIHALSPRREQPLVTINCGALTESLVEAQLFGHEKGYFTGADRARDGYLTEAGRGTLFLDEIAELPLSLQTKLLRVLENRTFRVLGASHDSRFEGCIIAATHVDLQSRVRDGRFREDLYYRLEVLTVSVPSLDERKEDIPVLVEHFLRGMGRRLQFEPEALASLEQLDWPGNVRQLRNLVQRLAVFAERELITAADVELRRAAGNGQAEVLPILPQKKSARSVGEALVQGLSIRHQRKQNSLQLAQNQIRLLELEGRKPDAICNIMGIGRATLFRIKSGQE